LINFSNTAAANTLIASSTAFRVTAQYNSAYFANLFYNNVGRTYSLKMVSIDPLSKSSLNRVEELFTVTFKHKCADNEITLSSDIGKQIYYIDYPTAGPGVASKTITPSISTTETIGNCPLTCKLEKWNSSTLLWESEASPGAWSWKTSFTTLNTGQIIVYTADYATYHPITSYPNINSWTDIDLRVTIVDDRSV
jgi:hypothetical protein